MTSPSDAVVPQPTQGLLIELNSNYAIVAPLQTNQEAERARQFATALGYTLHGVFQVFGFGELEAVAQSKGVFAEQFKPLGQAKPPAGLRALTTEHVPGCIYKDFDHPGKCYVPPEPLRTCARCGYQSHDHTQISGGACTDRERCDQAALAIGLALNDEPVL